MKVPPFQVRRGSGVPDEFARSLNQFSDKVTSALANQLTCSENLRATIKTLSLTTSPLWTNVDAFQNGWGNYLTYVARYAKLANGLVVLDGVVTGGSLPGTAFTLPPRYSPSQGVNVAAAANAVFGLLYVDPSGTVQPTAGSNVWFSLSGACFMSADPSPVSNLSSPLTFPHGLSSRCTDMVVTSVVSGDGTFAGAVAPDWRDNGDGTVTVSNLAGLTPGTTYTIRFLCLGEPA